ncbi:hypothetical protein NF717_09615 [Lactococcus formosensis]|uniref:DUF7336 domain-containing protein n=1 Tax=Lactococcus formosensis TaxID=1281486 RepID=A0A9X4SC00_9LACT|nr:hypothetical protein [Lactococcus formosensis]MDG6145901.1 hypothetical protein [Lactococcus formosensis]MDG6176383.1 hypothetical protein [Lactococcus formosensis]
MKVYIVTQSWGSYSDYTEVVLGVVSSMEKAKELALNAEPDSWEDRTVEVECFELNGEQKSFSKAEREAYKFNDTFDYKNRIVLNKL